MKVDPRAFFTGIGILAVIATALFFTGKKILRLFASILLGLIILDLLLIFVPSRLTEDAWWILHLPSAAILGFDEILERHGLFISTICHFADLILWSAVIIAPLMIREYLQRKAGNSKWSREKFHAP